MQDVLDGMNEKIDNSFIKQTRGINIMQAIVTKFLPVTNSRGARVKATCDAGSITISYPYGLSGEAVHKAAAVALSDKLGWHGELIGGGLPNQAGYAFVFMPASVDGLRDALGNLCQFVQGNRGNRDGNPFCKAELKDALVALYLHRNDGQHPASYDDYVNESDAYNQTSL